MIVDVVTEDARWEGVGLAALAESAAQAALAHLGHDGAFELALLAADDARIAALNADFRGKPTPTNVLSWPAQDLSPLAPGAAPSAPAPELPGEPIFLGDVALAYETCAAEAATGGKPLADHATHLVVHGVLHLLGYDHVEDADADLMEGLEAEILAGLGLPSPY